MRWRKSAFIFVLVLAAGFVLAVLQPAGPAFAGTFSQEAAGGLGNANNQDIYASARYQSKLFVGTINMANALEIYSFDGENWATEVGAGAPGTPTAPGFGDAGNLAALSMAVYGDCLYVGTGRLAGPCEIWRYDGTVWTPVVGSTSPVPAGFGDANSTDVMSMAVYGAELYAGIRNFATGCEVWRYDGVNWNPVVGSTSPVPAGFGSTNDTVRSMCDYGPYLYAGTANGVAGCEVWRFDGVNWTPLVGPTAPVAPGFGAAANRQASSMEVYAGILFVGTNNGGGCEVWTYDGTTWVQEVGPGPTATIGPGFGNPAISAVDDLYVYDSTLFAGTYSPFGACEVWSLNGVAWNQEVGGGAPGTPTGPGFGDANNNAASGMATLNDLLYIGTSNGATGCQVWSYQSSANWYLAEGATDGGFETWILVQNPNAIPVNVNLSFQTGGGPVPGLIDTIPAQSRRSYLVNTYVSTFDVSTLVNADADVICERSMYWTPEGSTVRRVGHDSIGVINPASTWYLAEGATAGGFETWVLVQNPNPNQVNVDVKFQTDAGEVQGPQDTLAPFSRKSYPVDNYVETFDVSTRVDSYMGDVVCERAVYFTPDGFVTREVGHESIGVVSPSYNWYLAEGATAGTFETWVLVQNPTSDWVNIDMKFQTEGGEVQGPVDPIPARSRKSYLVDNWVDTYDVSTSVTSTGGPVICERAMYEAPVVPTRREMGHDSIGTTVGALEWYLAEGATLGGFETWVLVQNPNTTAVDIDMKFQTGGGEVQGPVDTIDAQSRKSYLVNSWVSTYDVSTKVTSTAGGFIICERAVYWRPAPDAIRYLGTDSIGYGP